MSDNVIQLLKDQNEIHLASLRAVESSTIYPAAIWHALVKRLALKTPEDVMNVPLDLQVDSHVNGVVTGTVVCPIDNRKYRVTVELAQ